VCAASVAAADPAASDGGAAGGKPERIELTFAGDIMFGGFFGGVFSPKQPELGDHLADVSAQIGSDLAMANLETTILPAIPATEADTEKMRFVALEEQVASLAKHGVRHVNLANNHQFDMRTPGTVSTHEILAKLGIAWIGAPRAEEPLVRVETVEVRGYRIAFIAATKWMNDHPKQGEPRPVFILPDSDLAAQIIPSIEAAKADHDAVIVVLHWGREYEDEPRKNQVKAAHAMIDAGATAIIGHHPHVLQAVERYKGGVIAYSLGNFIFRNVTEPVRWTGILRLGLRADGKCLDKVELHPLVMVSEPIYRPVPAKGAQLKKVAARLQSLSKLLRTKWKLAGGTLTTTSACP
jgi:poly-gamma-glutamate synthesis protein (capsule biosynthesis protein)